MAKTCLATTCLEPAEARVIEIIADLQGSSVSACLRGMIRAEGIRLGLMPNPAIKYIPTAEAPVAPDAAA